MPTANNKTIHSKVMPYPDHTPTSVHPHPRDRMDRRLSIGMVAGCTVLNHRNHFGIAATGLQA